MYQMKSEFTNQERIDTLFEAQEHLFTAIDLINNAIRGTRHESYVDAYIVAHLKIMASSGHGYLSRDTNLDQVMEWFNPDSEEYADEEEMTEA